MSVDFNHKINPTQLRQKARETFIAMRTKEEQKFNNWYLSLLKCPKEVVLDKIPFDYQDMSLQSLVPEWYVEVPNAEVCEQQVKSLNEKLEIINCIIEEVNKEGLKLLEEYNQLYARG